MVRPFIANEVHLFILYVERRVNESQKILEKFKERIPVIIERATSEQKLPDLEQQK